MMVVYCQKCKQMLIKIDGLKNCGGNIAIWACINPKCGRMYRQISCGKELAPKGETLKQIKGVSYTMHKENPRFVRRMIEASSTAGKKLKIKASAPMPSG